MLTDTQKQTLANALRAETNQAVVDALAIRNDVADRRHERLGAQP
jgi:hypothetical protein